MPLGEQPRRLAHQDASRTLAVGVVTTDYTVAEQPETAAVSCANSCTSSAWSCHSISVCRQHRPGCCHQTAQQHLWALQVRLVDDQTFETVDRFALDATEQVQI